MLRFQQSILIWDLLLPARCTKAAQQDANVGDKNVSPDANIGPKQLVMNTGHSCLLHAFSGVRITLSAELCCHMGRCFCQSKQIEEHKHSLPHLSSSLTTITHFNLSSKGLSGRDTGVYRIQYTHFLK